jgi:hypothetical protein
MSLHQNAEPNYRKKSDYKAFKIVAMCNGFEKACHKQRLQNSKNVRYS